MFSPRRRSYNIIHFNGILLFKLWKNESSETEDEFKNVSMTSLFKELKIRHEIRTSYFNHAACFFLKILKRHVFRLHGFVETNLRWIIPSVVFGCVEDWKCIGMMLNVSNVPWKTLKISSQAEKISNYNNDEKRWEQQINKNGTRFELHTCKLTHVLRRLIIIPTIWVTLQVRHDCRHRNNSVECRASQEQETIQQ